MTHTTSASLSDDAAARQNLRRLVRKRRLALSPTERRLAATQIAQQVCRFRPLQHARHIAMYAAYGSELSLEQAIAPLRKRGKSLYLPQIKGPRMRFVAAMGRKHSRNRYGISEPRSGRVRPVWAMDAILLPLLGFDLAGNRLGQGGGYYDRALATCRFRQPRLIGIAYDVQQLARAPCAAWDVPLHALLTPTRRMIFGP